MSTQYSSRQLFEHLNGRDFGTYPELEKEVKKLYIANLSSFPAEYSVHRLLDLAESRRWIVRSGQSYRVVFVED